MNTQYILQQSTTTGWWIATDTENGIVIRFKEHQFNDTQEVTLLEDNPNPNPLVLARQMREITDWLATNHGNIVL